MKTLKAFEADFPNEDACKKLLAECRWPDGPVCPRCGNARVITLKSKPHHWVCKSGITTTDTKGQQVTCAKNGDYRFSVITKTIFQDTKIPLDKWFRVAYLMLTSKKGISALQIHRVIFGEKSTHDYHTSWYMCMRWRAAMAGDMFAPLSGVVEADETYVGGKDKNRHWNKKSAQRRAAVGELPLGQSKYGYGKVGVIGAIERKGNVVARVIGSQDAPTLAGFVRKVMDKNVSLVVTDEHKDYNYVDRNLPHQTVKHSAGEYVRGEVHTNSIESFWSLLKRGVMGTYHNVSAKYLPFYLNEFSFRFNNRNNDEMFADLITTCSQ